jgi:capsular polysaccharide export protein
MSPEQSKPFLRVPPFPGAKVHSLARRRSGPVEVLSDYEVDELIAEIERLRVGGDYWNMQRAGDTRGLLTASSAERRARLRHEIHEPFEYVDPFTNEPISLAEAIRLCGFWRSLIDSNRDIGSAVGFAFWKKPTAAPLLWDGSGGPRFASDMKDIDPSRAVAVWKARTAPSLLAELERSGAILIEVEDGFIRSAGLGADCVPPLSIVVDRLGVHFDPTGPSELENLIAEGRFPPELLDRARLVREVMVASGVSKYGAGASAAERRGGNRPHILVPGQVEDDRAVTSGLGSVRTNIELVRRVRQQRPEAYIIYKPHPDVEAGHRSGSLDDRECLGLADEIVRATPITALIEAVDEVHVISSLAGFEALLRGKAVTTYGTPFYAGWSLTNDQGPIPDRRSAKRSLDELVAAVLLLYPRYLDPATGLPCPPEILIRRLAEGSGNSSERIIVHLRRLQGRLKKRLARVGLG